MKRWILCICAVAVFSQQNAQAQWETKGFVGVNSAPATNFQLGGSRSSVAFWESEVDLGPIVGLTVGRSINPRFNIEGELAYRYNHGTYVSTWDNSDGTSNLHQVNGMANILYSVFPSRFVQPYLGLGMGLFFASHALHSNRQSNLYISDLWRKEWGPSVQGLAGLNLGRIKNVDFGTEYRFTQNRIRKGDRNQSLSLVSGIKF